MLCLLVTVAVVCLQPLHNSVVRQGERVVLECTIPPHPPPERVQWFRNEIEIKPSNDYQIVYGAYSHTFAAAKGKIQKKKGKFVSEPHVKPVSRSAGPDARDKANFDVKILLSQWNCPHCNQRATCDATNIRMGPDSIYLRYTSRIAFSVDGDLGLL